jgi:hypothetical protein
MGAAATKSCKFSVLSAGNSWVLLAKLKVELELKLKLKLKHGSSISCDRSNLNSWEEIISSQIVQQKVDADTEIPTKVLFWSILIQAHS